MTKDEKDHKRKLAEHGCVACWRLHGCTTYEVELHHFRGGGWGKGDYKTLMPLCYQHHRGRFGVHGLGTKGFDAHFGDKTIYKERAFTQRDLLDDALRATGETA